MTSNARTLLRRSAAALAGGALVVGALVSTAPAASAAAAPVLAAQGNWGFKASFRTYVAEETGRSASSTAARASITPSDGATFDGSLDSTRKPAINKAPYVWPTSANPGSYDPSTKAGTINLGGSVSFVFPVHFINQMRWSNPSIVLDGDGTGTLYTDVRTDVYGGISGSPQVVHDDGHVAIAELSAVPTPTTDANADGTTTTTFTGITATLTAAGASSSNDFYGEGTVIDPFTVRFVQGPVNASTATTTTLTTSPSAVGAAGQAVTLTAALPYAGATGAVEFFDGATSLGTSPVSFGSATKSVVLAVGAHTLTAQFVPTAATNYLGSTSDAVAFTATQLVSTTTISLTPSSVAYGRARTAKVTVTGGNAVASGAVTLKDGARSLGTKNLGSGGYATWALSRTSSVGKHALTASYAGSTPLTPSTRTATLTVVKASTTSRASLTAKSVKVGKRGTLVATVAASGFTPAGKVVVKDGSKVLRTVTLSRGKATITLPKLAKGTHKLTVRYPGSSSAKASTSAKVTLTVKRT